MALPDPPEKQRIFVNLFTDAVLRIGVIAVIVYLCLQVFSPFLVLMLWGLILAIALYPLHLMLVKKCRGKEGLSASIIVILGLILIGGPTLTMGNAFATYLHESFSNFEQGKIEISAPKESVADWPIIGDKVYNVWTAATTDLPDLIERSRDQLNSASKYALGVAKATLSSLFTFIGALIIAVIMMAYGKSGTEAMLNIFIRFSKKKKANPCTL